MNDVITNINITFGYQLNKNLQEKNLIFKYSFSEKI